MEAIIQKTDLTPATFIGVSTFLCVLTSIVVGLRLYTNYGQTRKLYADDLLAVLAIVFLVWNTATFALLMNLLNSNPQTVTITHLTRLVAIGIASGNCAVFSAKLPLLFLLIRTFGIKKWLKWTCMFLIFAGIVGGLVTLLFAGVECSPDLHTPTPPFLFKCVNSLTNATIARGSISLAIDIIMFFLPIPIILQLNLPLRRKIGLGLAFATGLAAIAASALGLYYQKAQSADTSSNFANALLVTIVEAAVVILVSCTPAIHLFWTRYMHGIRTRMGLSTTNASTNKSKLASKKRNTSTSDSDSTRVQNHDYVELEDGMTRHKPMYEATAFSNDRRM